MKHIRIENRIDHNTPCQYTISVQECSHGDMAQSGSVETCLGGPIGRRPFPRKYL